MIQRLTTAITSVTIIPFTKAATAIHIVEYSSGAAIMVLWLNPRLDLHQGAEVRTTPAGWVHAIAGVASDCLHVLSVRL
jgi:hypothetical protein